MRSSISPTHPLRRFFVELAQRHLIEAAKVEDQQVAQYIANLLADFTHVENLYRIRNSQGRRLEDVGEMLLASNPLLDAPSFIYEREVRKHIGDYTLFIAGLFPEHIARISRQKQKLDSLIDYLKAGKESYRIVASFDQFEFRDQAPLFRRLAERFELCVYGLNLMKQDLARRQSAYYQGLWTALHS